MVIKKTTKNKPTGKPDPNKPKKTTKAKAKPRQKPKPKPEPKLIPKPKATPKPKAKPKPKSKPKRKKRSKPRYKPGKRVFKKTIKKEGGQKGNKNAEQWTEEEALVIAQGLVKWIMPNMKSNDNGRGEVDLHIANIFVAEYCLLKGLGKGQVAHLCEKYESFQSLHARAKEFQEIKLAKLAYFKKADPNIAKFLLINHHNYTGDSLKLTGTGDNDEIEMTVVIGDKNVKD